VNDPRFEFVGNEPVDRIDVLTASGAGAEMMKTRAQLIERCVRASLGHRADANSRPATDAIDGVIALYERFYVEERAELLPERETAGSVVDGQLDVGDAVQFETTARSAPSRTWRRACAPRRSRRRS
jgi:hypothetical protein